MEVVIMGPWKMSLVSKSAIFNFQDCWKKSKQNMPKPWVVPPPRMPVANEGLEGSPILKMVHNPGGDWHPGRGDNPT